MDSDNISSFSEYFTDGSFAIRESAERGNDVILWMTFSPVRQELNLSVYDGEKSCYTHVFNGENRDDVVAFINNVCVDYKTFIPSRFTGLPSKFLKLKHDSFSLDVNITDEFDDCDSCGDVNGNTIQAFYFPAISEHHAASLSVHWNFGCYGGEARYGNFVDTKKGVLSILHRAVKTTDKPEVAEEIHAFISKVKALA